MRAGSGDEIGHQAPVVQKLDSTKHSLFQALGLWGKSEKAGERGNREPGTGYTKTVFWIALLSTG